MKEMTAHNSQHTKDPLITVAIPTYNRPDSLALAINDICSQTYKNLEILIGDNASTNPFVQDICIEASKADPRIRVIRHPENIGAYANFLHLLHVARGEFFMWAADDDRHDVNFIRTCLAPFLKDTEGVLACVMTGYIIHNYCTGESTSGPIPILNVSHNPSIALLESLRTVAPALIYGLHRREVLIAAKIAHCDWSDCLFTWELIANGWRIKTLPEYQYYTAGIYTSPYELKPTHPSTKRIFQYYPVLSRALIAIWSSQFLCFSLRCRASVAVIQYFLYSFLLYEKKRQLLLWRFHKSITFPIITLCNKKSTSASNFQRKILLDSSSLS